ncbi:hypothetical protein GM921_15125 [Pedobacter sp. LMG 31464]|uniref:Uncharacterized protein n=1 Tax=Pedobacter planticolens TaxID=2679964 RepID=A0A923IX60_9SPHI|nr:hypothetical protein [Pedobacter planticolens]MBB2146834.1 hypothetical protein [Pedobacter planticolens]
MKNFFGRFDASVFKQNAKLYYEGELVSILNKISQCHSISLSFNDLYRNNEDSIRDQLHCNYLNNTEIKKKIGLRYHFECEPKEFGVGEGYLDIKVFNANIFKNPSEYFIIECKRLNSLNLKGRTGLNAEYIEHGIMRFVKEKYSCYHRINAMIGFIVSKLDLDENINNINHLLINEFPDSNTTDVIKPYSNQSSQPFISKHYDVSKRPFRLYHLMLDYSSNLLSAN